MKNHSKKTQHKLYNVNRGHYRSGTTWLQEIINYNGIYRPMFEPFHYDQLEILKNWNKHQYIRPEIKDEKYLVPAKLILSGRITHGWVDQFNTKWIDRKRLVKDIWANLFLKWIKVNFPEIPIILLIRHPCAVAQSKLRFGWKTDLDDYLKQRDLVSDYLTVMKPEIERAVDPFDRLIFSWCIENYIPLQQLDHKEFHLVFYEHLCIEPEKSIRSIFEFIGIPFDHNVLSASRQPSRLARQWSAIYNSKDLISDWSLFVTEEKKKRTIEILRLFNLDKIYGVDPIPLI